MKANDSELPALGIKSRYADVNPSIIFIFLITIPIYLKMRTIEDTVFLISSGLFIPCFISLKNPTDKYA